MEVTYDLSIHSLIKPPTTTSAPVAEDMAE
jgi:hypothetical protein